MTAKTTSQMSFADGLIYRREGVNEMLDRVGLAIDWSRVDQVLVDHKPRRAGAPGYPALVLFKAVLLAQWHNLSDEAMEAMLADRLSFQRFWRTRGRVHPARGSVRASAC
jgi:IS5 family transposase